MDDKRERFEAIALRYLDLLYYAALHWTGHQQDSDELVQETYLRAYKTFSNFKEGTNCKAWLFTIMYSIFVNQYHKKMREGPLLPPEEIDLRYQHSLFNNSNQDLTPECTGQEVEKALLELPQIFRTSIILVDIEGFSYEEAAEILTLPIGTIRSRLFRGRKLLYIALKEYAQKIGFSETRK